MTWLLLTFISVVCRALYGIMSKILSSSAKTSPYTQATLLSAVCAAVGLILTPFLGGLTTDFSKVSILTVALVALGQGLGNIFYFTAIKSLTNGTAQIAFSSILIFNTVLSLLFLNLHLSALNIFGVILLLIAIMSVVSGKVVFDKRGIVLMVIGSFFYAVFQLSSSKLSHQVSAGTYLLIAYAGGALVVFLIKSKLIIHDMRQPGAKLAIRNSLYAAVPSLSNFLFAYYAYRSAPRPAIVAILLTSQVVVTIILGYFILKERDNVKRKVGAALLVVASAALIKD